MGEQGTILTSSDGTTWTSRTSGRYDALNRGTYGNSTFVVVGDNATGVGTILTSPDAITRTSRTSGTSEQLWEVTYANSTFVVLGSTGTIPRDLLMHQKFYYPKRFHLKK